MLINIYFTYSSSRSWKKQRKPIMNKVYSLSLSLASLVFYVRLHPWKVPKSPIITGKTGAFNTKAGAILHINPATSNETKPQNKYSYKIQLEEFNTCPPGRCCKMNLTSWRCFFANHSVGERDIWKANYTKISFVLMYAKLWNTFHFIPNLFKSF